MEAAASSESPARADAIGLGQTLPLAVFACLLRVLRWSCTDKML